jgi:galactose mutarotase-like enzyme
MLRDDVLLRAGESTATVLPWRGGMVLRSTIGGREIFYADDATVDDPSKNVRGGAPVLFPSPGKLANDRWAHGAMGQHGFARGRVFAISARTDDSVTLRIEDDEASRVPFPFRFSFELTYALTASALRIDARVENRDDVPMPFGVGFHPYFPVPVGDKGRVRVPTAATRAFDNVTKQRVAYATPDFAGGEVDLHLLDHGASEADLVTPSGTIRLRGSPEYAHWVLWTQPGKGFVCLEPWTCPGDALNTGERLVHLAPGQTCALWLEIAPA